MKTFESKFSTCSKQTLRSLSKKMNKESIDFRLLYQHDLYKNATVILAYKALSYEVSIDNLLNHILLDNKQLYLAKMEQSSLSFLRVNNVDTELVKGKYNIMEPLHSLTAWQWEKEQSILLFAPALASDEDGYRVGHGCGYYDRFLAGYTDKSNMTSILINDHRWDKVYFPHDAHDIPFDYVLTSGGLRQCRR